MGCTSSKVDDSPAVTLCRERCNSLDDAIHQRYALADAHLAYLASLKSVGVSLHRFFQHKPDDLLLPAPATEPLPSDKAANTPPPLEEPAHQQNRASHSSSGSHLHFHSDSEDELSAGSHSLRHHSGASSPLHHDHPPYGYAESFGFSGGGFVHMNYMRNQVTPSVVYEQRPVSSETLHVANSSDAPFFPYANYQNPSSYSFYGYSNSAGGFSASSPPHMPYGSSSTEGASTSKPPPPPPSPPRASGWEFLNPFESAYESYYPPYASSKDSRELREEEGIPDLEEEDYQQEIVKEVHIHPKLSEGGSSGRSHSKAGDDENRNGNHEDSRSVSRPSTSIDGDPVEYEVHVMGKNTVNDEKRQQDQANVAGVKAYSSLKDDSEVIREILVQFERASESGNDLTTILEVGKLPYTYKRSSYQVSSKMFQAISPSRPSTLKGTEMEKADPGYFDVDEELDLRSRNLSSTLHKLYLWEKKLYEEVKVEEKMRVLHERKSHKLKHLDDRGAEFHKVDATRTLVRSLSTKIRIAIQVVDKISVKINKLRDDDLWPLLHEFIQRLNQMWKGMLECHHHQCQAIVVAKKLDAIASHKFSDSHLEATMQLEHDVLNWILRFSCWVSAQKGFVRALNNWLVKCLLYVPEETPDGIAPFSPGRIGAPAVFVICNQWSQSLDSVSEKEVLECMRDFATNVLQLWDRDKFEMRQKMIVDKDMERKVRNLEKEDQKIQKEIQALDKRMVLVSGDDSSIAVTRKVVYQSDTTKSGSFQVGLQRIFEAMEKFAGNSLRVYEELMQRIDEDTSAQTNEEVS